MLHSMIAVRTESSVSVERDVERRQQTCCCSGVGLDDHCIAAYHLRSKEQCRRILVSTTHIRLHAAALFELKSCIPDGGKQLAI